MNPCENPPGPAHLNCEICPCFCHIDQRPAKYVSIDPVTGEQKYFADDWWAWRHHAISHNLHEWETHLQYGCTTCGLQPEEGTTTNGLCCAALSHLVKTTSLL